MAVASGMCLLDSATAFVQLVPPAISWQGHAGTKNNVIPQACNSPARQQPRSTRAAIVSMAVAEGAAAADDGGASLPRVLCHGEILFDCIANPEAAGWGLKEVEESAAWKAYPGGAPANVACALAKLGVPASFVGAVGRDKEGEELLQVLRDSGVGTELATTIDDYPTRTVMVTRDVDGDRTFAGFGGGKASDSFADCQHRLREMEDAAKGKLKPGAWVVQGTLGLAYTDSFESHVRLAEWAKEAGAVRYLDINWRPVFWELAAGERGEQSAYESLARERITDFAATADVIKLTDEEAEWLCGVSGETALLDPSCLQNFFPASKAILVTAGEKGAAYTIGGHTGFIPVFKSIEVVETTGAGDAFSAGFVSEAIKFLSAKHKGDIGMAAGGEGEGGAARDMVRFASAVGALTCCGDGAIKPQPLHGDVRGLLAAEGASSPASAAAASAAATTQS
ncbi:unnamed protein product [Pylaiella littoralis]